MNTSGRSDPRFRQEVFLPENSILADRVGEILRAATARYETTAPGNGTEDRDAAPETGIDALAWPTKDRPELLIRSMEAWAGQLRRNDEPPPIFVVADDSDHEAERTASAVGDFAARHSGTVVYLSRGDREAFARELDRSCDGLASTALGTGSNGDALLPGVGRYGATRNTLLLLLAGRAFAMADDDTVPDFRLPRDLRSGLAVDGPNDSVRLQPMGDGVPDDGSPGARPDGSPTTIYKEYLGKSSASLLLGSEFLDLRNATPGTATRLLDRKSRIGVLGFGSWGDSGMGNPRYLLTARGSVDPGAYEEERYRCAAAGGRVFRSRPRPSLGWTPLMGMQLGLDARTRLPPFVPSGRDEDGLWGLCLRILHPETTIAQLPEAVLHDPDPARRSGGAAALRWGLRVNDLYRAVIATTARSLEPDPLDYERIGRAVTELARAPERRFRETIAELARGMLGGRFRHLETELERFGAEPAWWAEDMSAAMDHLSQVLERPDFWVPQEWHGSSPERVERNLATGLDRFGELLSAWPTLFDEASRLGGEILAGTGGISAGNPRRS